MRSRHIHMPARYARTMGEAFKTPEWANPIEIPPPRRPGIGRWLVVSAFATLFVYLITGRA